MSGMRLYFCFALMLLAIYLSVWRPVFLKKKFPAISVVLTVILLGIFGWQEIQWQKVEWEGTAVVKEISGNKEGYLKCQRFSEAFFDVNTTRGGMVMSDAPNEAIVNYEQCQSIMGWMESGKKSMTSKELQSLHVLTHEAVHVAGERNEAVTECTAINRDNMTVSILGAPDALALETPQRYYDEFFNRMPSEYRLDGCSVSPEYDSLRGK